MSGVTKQVVFPPNVIKPLAPKSPAVLDDKYVYVSGIHGIDEHRKLVPGGAGPEARRALEILSEVLEASGSNMELVLKTTLFLSDMDDFFRVNEEYARVFKVGNLPARSCVAVKSLPLNANVQIDAIALRAKPVSSCNCNCK